MKKALMISMFAFLLLSFSQMAYARGHQEAGYDWAKEHDVKDDHFDDGNSESFNDGVRDYAKERENEDAVYDAEVGAAEDSGDYAEEDVEQQDATSQDNDQPNT